MGVSGVRDLRQESEEEEQEPPFSPPGTQASREEVTEITQSRAQGSGHVPVSQPCCPHCHSPVPSPQAGQAAGGFIGQTHNQWQDGKRPPDWGC